MPTESPNIVLFLADDLGFSDLGCYGGEISTPNLDALAASGTRLTQFYNTARCTPSRASLLTGLHPHQVGTGILTGDDGPLGYPGDLNHRGATLAEMLKPEGYDTAVIGKWHLADSMFEPSHAWPTRRGFDYFYGTLTGCGSYFQPGTLARNEEPIPEEAEAADFYYTEAIADEAVQYVSADARKDSPFFLYVPFTAPHWPLHAPEDEVARYAGRFSRGWDVLREERLERQKALGIIEEDARLSGRDPDEPAWEDVEEKDWFARRMEVYAAQVELMDRAIGRVLHALEEQGLTENTIVIFLSDNGASPEEIPHIGNGTFIDRPDIFSPLTKDGEPVALGSRPGIVPGPATTYSSYGRAWANLSNTPFRLYKKWVHEGGIAAPFIFRWPARQKEHGGILRTPHQLTHVVPTLLEATGAPYPSEVGGHEILPPEGRSFLDEALTASGDDDHDNTTLFWEHAGNAAIRRGDMKLVRRWPGPWELYDLSTDPTELDDVLAEHRELAEELFVEWTGWAERSGVVPFDRIAQLFAIRGLTPDDAAR